MSFKGLKKLGDEKNRSTISKFPKSKYFFAKDEKELTSKNLLKKTQELENLQKNSNVSPPLSFTNNNDNISSQNDKKSDHNISFSNYNPNMRSNEPLINFQGLNINNNTNSMSNNNNNNNENNRERGSIQSNSSGVSRISNCGRQLY